MFIYSTRMEEDYEHQGIQRYGGGSDDNSTLNMYTIFQVTYS